LLHRVYEISAKLGIGAGNITLCGLQSAVAEQTGETVDRHRVLGQASSEGMPELMTREVNLCFLTQSFEAVLNPGYTNRLAMVVDKHVPRLQRWTDRQPRSQGGQDGICQPHEPFFVAFAQHPQLS
jgi:hypothetical protein